MTVLVTPEPMPPTSVLPSARGGDDVVRVLPADDAAAASRGRPVDRDAEFTAFATTARAELGRTAWLLTGDVHQAAELVQVALVRTYVAWPRARAGEPLAYARRVLANARIDGWRRRRREVLVAPAELPDAPAPDDDAARGERDRLARALATLSAGQRRVVVLRYFVGLSEQETADDLGVSTGTVKTQASRGLRRLREELGTTERAAEEGGRHA